MVTIEPINTEILIWKNSNSSRKRNYPPVFQKSRFNLHQAMNLG